MLSRFYLNEFDSLLRPGKVLVLYGPRRAGKTTLVNAYLKTTAYRYRSETGDDLRFREIIESERVELITDYARGYELIVIDEAQRITNVGLALKLLADHASHARVLATGSASFDLATKVGEPLTGRKVTRVLYPLAQLELRPDRSKFDLQQQLSEFLLYGSYPETLVAATKEEKIEYLRELTSSYLCKDILELENIKSSKILLDLLRLLAFQIGKDVSYSELASQLGIDAKTVARYLDLLEKTFVLKSLTGFSRNLRKEVSKSKRYYFLDPGVRNAIISNFNPLNMRDDVGALWENFLFVERMKRNEYSRSLANQYFWRTYDQQEIDLLEEQGGVLEAFEFKWRDKHPKPPISFSKAYPQSVFNVINRDNYLDFVAPV